MKIKTYFLFNALSIIERFMDVVEDFDVGFLFVLILLRLFFLGNLLCKLVLLVRFVLQGGLDVLFISK